MIFKVVNLNEVQTLNSKQKVTFDKLMEFVRAKFKKLPAKFQLIHKVQRSQDLVIQSDEQLDILYGWGQAKAKIEVQKIGDDAEEKSQAKVQSQINQQKSQLPEEKKEPNHEETVKKQQEEPNNDKQNSAKQMFPERFLNDPQKMAMMTQMRNKSKPTPTPDQKTQPSPTPQIPKNPEPKKFQINPKSLPLYMDDDDDLIHNVDLKKSAKEKNKNKPNSSVFPPFPMAGNPMRNGDPLGGMGMGGMGLGGMGMGGIGMGGMGMGGMGMGGMGSGSSGLGGMGSGSGLGGLMGMMNSMGNRGPSMGMGMNPNLMRSPNPMNSSNSQEEPDIGTLLALMSMMNNSNPMNNQNPLRNPNPLKPQGTSSNQPDLSNMLGLMGLQGHNPKNNSNPVLDPPSMNSFSNPSRAMGNSMFNNPSPINQNIGSTPFNSGSLFNQTSSSPMPKPPQPQQRPNLIQALGLPPPNELSKKIQSSKPNQQQTKLLHINVYCSQCFQSPIRGIRYICTQCQFYNLCQNCQKNSPHTLSHIFLKVTKIQQTPITIRTFINEETTQSKRKEREEEIEREIKEEEALMDLTYQICDLCKVDENFERGFVRNVYEAVVGHRRKSKEVIIEKVLEEIHERKQ